MFVGSFLDISRKSYDIDIKFHSAVNFLRNLLHRLYRYKTLNCDDWGGGVLVTVTFSPYCFLPSTTVSQLLFLIVLRRGLFV